jgi:CHASE3 domain sensor protein
MKVGTRIWLVALLLGLIGSAALAVVLPSLRDVQARYEAILSRAVELRLNTARLRDLLHERAAARQAYVLTGSSTDREAYASAQRK